MYWDTQQEEFYHKNKKANGNLSHSYQEQCNQQNETTRYTTKNYSQQWKPLQSGDNTYWIPQRNSKSEQTMKISSISGNHTNLIKDKQGGT